MSADTAVLPPWKLAILNKKKQKEAEEQRIKDEEQAYLKSLPPWKRAIVLKNRASSGHPVSPESAKDRPSGSEVQRQPSPDHGGKVTSMAKSFLGGNTKQSPTPAPETRPARTTSTVKAKRTSFESDTVEVTPLRSGPTTPPWKKALTDKSTGGSMANGGPAHLSTHTPKTCPAPSSSSVKDKRASFESDTVEVVPLHSVPAPPSSSTASSSNKPTTPAWKKALADRGKGVAMANGQPSRISTPAPKTGPAAPLSSATEKRSSFESDAVQVAPSHSEFIPTPQRQKPLLDKSSSDTPVVNGGPLYSPPPALQPQQRSRSTSDSVHPSSVGSRAVKSPATPVMTEPRPRLNTQPARPVARTASPEASTGGEKAGGEDSSLDHLPPWKREIILRKRQKAQQGASPPSTAGQETLDGAKGSKHSTSGTVKKQQPSSNIFKLMPRVASPIHTLKESEQAAAKMMTTTPKQPATVPMTSPPKQTTAAKQSATVNHAVTAKHQTARNQSLTNTPSAVARQSAAVPPAVRSEEKRLAPKTERNKREIERPVNSVNSPESAVSPEQNPKELIPPVFPEVEPWSRVSEEDPAFKALPPWKQALILRRRHDIQLRSCAPEYLRLREEQQETTKVDKTEGTRVDTVWSPTSGIDLPHLRHVARPEPQKSSQTEEEAEEKIPPWKMDFIRNRRLKEQLRAEKEGAPVHHQIHVPGSEDEEEVFTYIDDLEADEEYLVQNEVDEVGDLKEIRLRSACSSSSSVTSTGILLSAEKKRSNSGLGRRTVSWNDLQTTEHNYPKYTYDDYDDSNPEGVSGDSLPNEEVDGEDTDGGQREDTAPSTPIHPSLHPGSIDPVKGGVTMSSYTPSILASLSSFAAYNDPWASYSSSYSKQADATTTSAKKEEKKEEPLPPPEEILPAEDDPMGGWGEQTSDLLW